MSENKLDVQHTSIHRMEHNSFIYDAKNLRSSLMTAEDLPEVTEKFVCFVTSWLTYHILGIDKVMAVQIFAIQHGATPEQAYKQYHTLLMMLK